MFMLPDFSADPVDTNSGVTPDKEQRGEHVTAAALHLPVTGRACGSGLFSKGDAE